MLIIFIGIQFIQPARNKSRQAFQTSITKTNNVPESVQAILNTACYNCHSNNTSYPWYANIQPMGWVLAKHIGNGKAELNFDEFGSYSRRRKESKLHSITNSIKDGTMPLPSYLRMHKDAQLTENEKEIIIKWASKPKDSLTEKIKSCF